jgi:hypothetical protein
LFADAKPVATGKSPLAPLFQRGDALKTAIKRTEQWQAQ